MSQNKPLGSVLQLQDGLQEKLELEGETSLRCENRDFGSQRTWQSVLHLGQNIKTPTNTTYTSSITFLKQAGKTQSNKSKLTKYQIRPSRKVKHYFKLICSPNNEWGEKEPVYKETQTQNTRLFFGTFLFVLLFCTPSNTPVHFACTSSLLKEPLCPLCCEICWFCTFKMKPVHQSTP